MNKILFPLFFACVTLSSLSLQAQNLLKTTIQNKLGTSWSNNSISEYTYNDQNQITEVLMYTWNTTDSIWQKSTQITYNLNTNGEPISILTQIWDVWYNEWDNYNLQEYNYYTNGTLKDQTQKMWNGTDWDYSLKIICSYDANMDPSTEEFMLYNTGTSNWDNFQMQTYTVNASHQITSRTTGAWNETTSSYDLSSRTNFSYLSTGLNNLTVNQNYNSGVWVDYNKSINSYNLAGITSSTLTKQYNTTTFAWEDQYRTDFNINPSNLVIDNMSFQYDKPTSTWMEVSKMMNEFEIVNDITETENMEVKLYPNPSTSYIKIDGGKSLIVSIRNSQGQLIYNNQVNSDEVINVQNWSNGIYFVTIPELGITKSFVKQ